jgi:hypothetical protein
MFQPKAWADRVFSNEWATKFFGLWLQTEHVDEETLLLCDGLDSQKTPEFKNILQTNLCSRLISPPDCTDCLQAVDAGLGGLVKFKMSQEFEKWLEVDDNLHQWEDGSVSASDKRVLLTRFLGSAWEEIFSNPHYHPRTYFERTGSLMTVDGSEDNLIQIKGCSYTVPPPRTDNFYDDDSDEEEVPSEEPLVPDEDIDVDEEAEDLEIEEYSGDFEADEVVSMLPL